MTAVRLVTLEPGHFHAALVQKEMYPGVDPTVHVYAALGPDLLAHLGRIAGFNGAGTARHRGSSRYTQGRNRWPRYCATGQATSSFCPDETAAKSIASLPRSRRASTSWPTSRG
jgi:hypothetical protein